MGASVEMPDSHHATLSGPAALHGAEVEMGDLRAGASLILAALAAEGTCPSTARTTFGEGMRTSRASSSSSARR